MLHGKISDDSYTSTLSYIFIRNQLNMNVQKMEKDRKGWFSVRWGDHWGTFSRLIFRSLSAIITSNDCPTLLNIDLKTLFS